MAEMRIAPLKVCGRRCHRNEERDGKFWKQTSVGGQRKESEEEEQSWELGDDSEMVTTFKQISAMFELQESSRRQQELNETSGKLKQELESLHGRKEELEKDFQREVESKLSFYDFLKAEDARQGVEKAEKERKEVLEKTQEIERLKMEKAQMIERHKQMKLDIQSHLKYRGFFERLGKLTKFKDMGLLSDYVTGLVQLRDQLFKRYREALEQVDQMKKEMASLNNKEELLQLQRNTELSQLKTVHDDALCEALVLERKWNHIQETSAKKTLQLGRIKMATINLFEMIGGIVEEEDTVDVNATKKRLEKIKMFLQEYTNTVKHDLPSEIEYDG
ncbi:coiled-coil domain-containing protein 42 [Echeneis naucrates]|uniref:coiled-coil domain-containing protein 42 n=1 Tax=Echeneis naucrates TaxID=173247 RepID=UPI00111434ED|nr:cilia- and flagella-associated protein 73 [Echeneis naucrates]